jgi:hypothetical protein
MQSADANPQLGDQVRVFALIVSIILVLGSSLLIVPTLVGPAWPWSIVPFNARFLGAIYLAELVAVLTWFLINRWSPVRFSLLLAVIFTALDQ